MVDSIMQRVRQQVQAFEPGELLTYADLATDPSCFGAVAAALSRLSRQGVLKRYAKGQYYRPQTSRFGTLQPSEGSVVRQLTKPAGTLAAYPAGVSLYNQLGLTTQVSAELVVTTPKQRRARPRRVAFVVRPAPERASDVPLLQWLEVLRDLRRIPDTSPDKVLARVQREVKRLSAAARRRLTELAARQAPPRARALLGALLELQADKKGAAELRATLNSLTAYRLGLSAAALPNRAAWNIQ
jgi:hypothetical protein